MTTRVEPQPIRFLAAMAIFALALFVQIFLASAGWYLNLSLVALLAFAFILDFFELLLLDLIAVWLLNWQPAPSFALLVFAAIPVAAFMIRKMIHVETWIGMLGGVAIGWILFNLVAGR